MKRLALAALCCVSLAGIPAIAGEYGGASPDSILFVTAEVMGQADAALKCSGVNKDAVMAELRALQEDTDAAVGKGGNPEKFQQDRAMAFRSHDGQCSSLQEMQEHWFFPVSSSAGTQSKSSCNDLWYYRNEIYKQAGYCFKTAKAIKTFGNAGCSYDNVESVPLSAAQRKEIAGLLRDERAMRCPK